MVKNGGFISWLLWFLLRSNHIQMHTPFSVDHTKYFWAFFERAAPRTLQETNLRANIFEWTYQEPCYMYIKWAIQLHKHYCVFRRDREPSRIPQTLEQFRNKNRKVREFVYKGIRSYTPHSNKKKEQSLHMSDEILALILKHVSSMDQIALRKNYCLLRIFPWHTMLTVSLFQTSDTHK